MKIAKEKSNLENIEEKEAEIHVNFRESARSQYDEKDRARPAKSRRRRKRKIEKKEDGEKPTEEAKEADTAEKTLEIENDAKSEASEPNEAIDIAKVMGFSGFGSTKGKKVDNNKAAAVSKAKAGTFRQYMNREKGFNRPLSPERKKL